MADVINHARAVSPWFIPNKGGTAEDLHGITDIGGAGASVSKDDVYVVGKKVKCASDKATPESTVPITQLERGLISGYLMLANKTAEPASGLTLTDFSNALVDAVLYIKDEFNGLVEETKYYPKTAIASLNLDIADPEARIERSFDLAGDNEITLTDDNKVLIHRQDTATLAGNHIIDATVLDPVPVQNPNDSAYILRLDSETGGVTTTLVLGTDYTYDNVLFEITVINSLIGDNYNVYYSAGDFGTAGDPTSVDTGSPCFLNADSVTVLISDGINEIELDLLSSLSINATLNRLDENVVGKEDRILREIEDTPVTVALSGRLKTADVEKAFMQKLDTTHGIQSVKLYSDNVRVTVKVYSDATKTSFLLGYQVDNLSFDDSAFNVTANEFTSIDFNASSDDVLISAVEGNLV